MRRRVQLSSDAAIVKGKKSRYVSSRPMEPSKKGTGSWLAQWVSAAALMSILISVVGYGAVMGVAHRFGQNHETMISSGLDLITMVWPAVLMVAVSLGKFLSTDVFWDIFRQTFVIPCATAAVVFCLLIARLPEVTRFIRWSQRARAWINPKNSFAKSVTLAATGSVLAGFLSGVALFLGAVFIWAILTLLLYLPLLGYFMGISYVDKNVVQPTQCETPSNRTVRMTLRDKGRNRDDEGDVVQAECVLISSLDAGKPFFRVGRTVLSSSSAMLLWNPETGNSYRTPLVGMEVSSVGEADFQQISELLAQYPTSCLQLVGDARRLVLKTTGVTPEQCKR
ncbi:hypothetical protein [Comamonas odontotermitis]|uniref:hypothetical protein n=1 Tax=Comamonas odontotermitis TaxID=379895 RepID=UPI001CC4EF4A|nr:hypothetical protein [Comamonas odontotermitis]UBB19377.1 hypothetical protein LAD35_20590 [Comamonas odontotermitis]